MLEQGRFVLFWVVAPDSLLQERLLKVKTNNEALFQCQLTTAIFRVVAALESAAFLRPPPPFSAEEREEDEEDRSRREHTSRNPGEEDTASSSLCTETRHGRPADHLYSHIMSSCPSLLLSSFLWSILT